jgi:hypothetical protein
VRQGSFALQARAAEFLDAKFRDQNFTRACDSSFAEPRENACDGRVIGSSSSSGRNGSKSFASWALPEPAST